MPTFSPGAIDSLWGHATSCSGPRTVRRCAGRSCHGGARCSSPRVCFRVGDRAPFRRDITPFASPTRRQCPWPSAASPRWPAPAQVILSGAILCLALRSPGLPQLVNRGLDLDLVGRPYAEPDPLSAREYAAHETPVVLREAQRGRRQLRKPARAIDAANAGRARPRERRVPLRQVSSAGSRGGLADAKRGHRSADRLLD